MSDYIKPPTYKDLEAQDSELEGLFTERFRDELGHFKRTVELFITLFSNARRTCGKPRGEDWVLLISVGILQNARAALLLALKGLFPQSMILTRSVGESVLLIYDFSVNPDHEDIWFNGGKKKREALFRANEVRTRVREANVTNAKAAASLNDLLSRWTVHANRESHLWYLETTDGTVKVRWAGQNPTDSNRAVITIMSALLALAHGLMVVVEEGFYTFTNSGWVETYFEWKKENLDFMKKFGEVIGDDSVQRITMRRPKILLVPNQQAHTQRKRK